MRGIFRKIFPSSNEKIIKSYSAFVHMINELESTYDKMSHSEILQKTEELKQKSLVLPDIKILPEAFALVREAASRILNMRHYDVQLLGGIALHNGCIAEMKTGEGKTLVSTLPAYLNALSGKGVHIVTVNEYLAKRDFEWMSRVHMYLGLTVGFIGSDSSDSKKRESYACDITYATNTELGFDYLRDNTKFRLEDMTILSRKPNYVIIDEIDSILVDEARTPLIISGASKNSSDLYVKINSIVKKLHSKHYEIEEKNNNIQLTDEGNEFVEELLRGIKLIKGSTSLYDAENFELINHVVQALRANNIFKKDKDYIVKNDSIMLVDEFTGRIMDGRRFSGGLHQALEAKEGVRIQKENQTIASITYQNFFRMYDKLSGMTGTAQTEAAEFFDIYGLSVISIPTQMPVIRKDYDDLIFKSENEKFTYLCGIIKERHKKGQPILVGTTSIGKSEKISSMLSVIGISHKVLNAKNHAFEAEIIASAGRKNSVTIATNMAGRGTDIILGGNLDSKILLAIKDLQETDDIKEITEKIRHEHDTEKNEVKTLGGLLVIGSERHESRRIDNQLRGRSGRLGDPGESMFLLALDDDLLRIFGGDKISGLLTRFGLKENEPMNHRMLNNAITRSQQRLESMHYEARKSVLKYDNIVNEQREIVYAERLKFVKSEDLTSHVYNILINVISDTYQKFIGKDGVFNKSEFEKKLIDLIGIKAFNYIIHDVRDQLEKNDDIADIEQFMAKKCLEYNEKRFLKHDQKTIKEMNRYVILISMDEVWKDHLHYLNHIKEGIHLRAYAQKDPFIEYKMESFNAFQNMFSDFKLSVFKKLMHIEIRNAESIENLECDLINNNEQNIIKSLKNSKIGRNDKCFCGSGKKFKLCCEKINN